RLTSIYVSGPYVVEHNIGSLGYQQRTIHQYDDEKAQLHIVHALDGDEIATDVINQFVREFLLLGVKMPKNIGAYVLNRIDWHCSRSVKQDPSIEQRDLLVGLAMYAIMLIFGFKSTANSDPSGGRPNASASWIVSRAAKSVGIRISPGTVRSAYKKN